MQTATKTKGPLIRVNKVVEITGLSRSYIYKLVHWKKIPHYKPTGGSLYFRESEVVDFISRNRQAADYEIAEQADAMLNGEIK